MTTMRRVIFTGALAAFVAGSTVPAAYAQAASNPPAGEVAAEVPTAPVVIDGTTLFSVMGYTGLTAAERARAIADRIVGFARTDDPPEALTAVDTGEYSQIMAGQTRIMILVDREVAIVGMSRGVAAEIYLARIRQAVAQFRRDRSPEALGRAAGTGAVATLVFGVVVIVTFWLYRRLRRAVESRYRARVKDLEIKSFQVVRAERLWLGVTAVLRLAWAAAAIAATFLYLDYVLVLFPWTRALGLALTSMLVGPLRVFGEGVLGLVPNAIFLTVVVVITRYLLKLLKLFFDGVASGRVKLEKFDPDWANPTFRLVRLLVMAFAIIVAYPYIPGSQTEAFKGVSLFIGVVFSLGSSSFIGNMVAGYSMTYRRAFRVGDRVKIGEHLGDVEHVRLMVTHLRTLKNEEVVVPNSAILNSEILNYSTMARTRGLILHTTVGIGYETPWRQVEAMLLEAVARTPGLLKDPAPFVIHKGLGDFAVTYEINAYCDDPHAMMPLYTELHRQILDVFNEYGVQIMTPAYEGDPAQPKVVQKSDWYLAPAKPSSPAR